MSTNPSRRKCNYPGSLTDLHRFRKTTHGHEGSSRIVMVRKTDQRTFASIQSGKEPKLEVVTRETIETFRGQRTACKITTEKKGCEKNVPANLIESLTERSRKGTPVKIQNVRVTTKKMDFQQTCLKAHNECRLKHGVKPLKLNREMCNISQDFANILVNKKQLEHSNNQKYGENIYCITTNRPNYTVKGDEPVNDWYEESSKHDFNKEPDSLETGHFTQVVWKESTELGVALASKNGKFVVVANYYPPGNIIGHYVENVLPLNNNNTLQKLGSKLSNLHLFNKKPAYSEEDNLFIQQCLLSHNKYREMHGVPPLKLDDSLCKYSLEWAKTCADKNKLEHRKNNQYGENIYYISSSDPNFSISGDEPVKCWYNEIKDHTFGKEPNSLKSGHFTQVVWKTSELLGVGVSRRNGVIYVVANYSPAGNFVGNFSENVLPLGTVLCKLEDNSEQNEVKISGQFTSFEIDALKCHNDYRKKHGVPDLKLSYDLCNFAKEWAQHCSNHGMYHRPNNTHGENIFMMYSSDFSFTPNAKEAVTAWYDEIREHKFGTENVNTKTLHFTQVVWKESKELGIGLAKNNKGETFIVANYNPRGNFVGQFVTNVPKPRS